VNNIAETMQYASWEFINIPAGDADGMRGPIDLPVEPAIDEFAPGGRSAAVKTNRELVEGTGASRLPRLARKAACVKLRHYRRIQFLAIGSIQAYTGCTAK
jgi:hypothetical protein